MNRGYIRESNRIDPEKIGFVYDQDRARVKFRKEPLIFNKWQTSKAIDAYNECFPMSASKQFEPSMRHSNVQNLIHKTDLNAEDSVKINSLQKQVTNMRKQIATLNHQSNREMYENKQIDNMEQKQIDSLRNEMERLKNAFYESSNARDKKIRQLSKQMHASKTGQSGYESDEYRKKSREEMNDLRQSVVQLNRQNKKLAKHIKKLKVSHAELTKSRTLSEHTNKSISIPSLPRISDSASLRGKQGVMYKDVKRKRSQSFSKGIRVRYRISEIEKKQANQAKSQSTSKQEKRTAENRVSDRSETPLVKVPDSSSEIEEEKAYKLFDNEMNAKSETPLMRAPDSESMPIDKQLFSSSQSEKHRVSFFGYMQTYLNKKILSEQMLQNLFKKMDTDNNGKIDINEFKECGNMMGLNFDDTDYQKEFDQIDVDKSGFVDHGEFRCMMLGKKTKKLTPNILRLIFDGTDKDKDGCLDFNEFKYLCKKMGFGMITNESHKDMKKYFEEVDVDKNGKIDFREFVFAILGRDLTQEQIKKCMKYSQCIERIKRVFKDLDTDNLGSLMVRDFVIAAKKLNCNENSASLKIIFRNNVAAKSKRISMKNFVIVMYSLCKDTFDQNIYENDDFFGWMRYGLQGVNMTELKLQSVFKYIDKDNNKCLDLDEFKQCGDLLGIEVFDHDHYQNEFDKADKDGDGYLDFGEFRCAVLGHDTKKLTPNILRLMFDETDRDGNGILDFNEFRFLCKKMGFGAFASESKRDMQRYFDAVDVDRNGFVDFREFVQAILGERLSDNAIEKCVKYSKMVMIIKKVFKLVDESGFGQLEFSEFLIAAKKLGCNERSEQLKVIFDKHAINGKVITLKGFVSVMYRLMVINQHRQPPLEAFVHQSIVDHAVEDYAIDRVEHGIISSEQSYNSQQHSAEKSYSDHEQSDGRYDDASPNEEVYRRKPKKKMQPMKKRKRKRKPDAIKKKRREKKSQSMSISDHSDAFSSEQEPKRKGKKKVIRKKRIRKKMKPNKNVKKKSSKKRSSDSFDSLDKASNEMSVSEHSDTSSSEPQQRGRRWPWSKKKKNPKKGPKNMKKKKKLAKKGKRKVKKSKKKKKR